MERELGASRLQAPATMPPRRLRERSASALRLQAAGEAEDHNPVPEVPGPRCRSFFGLVMAVGSDL